MTDLPTPQRTPTPEERELLKIAEGMSGELRRHYDAQILRQMLRFASWLTAHPELEPFAKVQKILEDAKALLAEILEGDYPATLDAFQHQQLEDALRSIGRVSQEYFEKLTPPADWNPAPKIP